MYARRCALLCSLLAVGCARIQDDAPSSPNVGVVQGALSVLDWPSLPLCTVINRGVVYYVTSDAKVVYCDGAKFQPLALQGGANGKDGVAYIVTTTAATSTQCPTGGVVIAAGADANKDGVIDVVSSSAAVCNGAQGPAGATGAAGAQGAAGSAGRDGSEGLESLVRQESEPAGANCPNGGTRIDSGVDADRDGQLEDAEIGQTTYVCAPGANVCSSGFHVCGSSGGTLTCADDSSPLSCGSSCTPCPTPANATTATCEAGVCGFACIVGYVAKDGVCTPALSCTGANWQSWFPNLSACDLTSASLDGASLNDANLTGADLSGASLQGASLNFANLFGANLSGADITSAGLNGANLGGANLSGANLSGANLYNANLTNANLTNANLNHTYLKYARLSAADLTGATWAVLSDADTDSTTICPSGSHGPCL